MLDGETLRLAFRFRRAVVHPAFQLLDFGGERAAQRDVQFLYAAADGQNRNALFNGGADQRQRCRVAGIVIRLEGRIRLHAVKGRVNVRFGTGDEKAVHRIQNGVEVHPVAEARHQKWGHTRNIDGGCQILFRRGVPGVVFKWLHIGRYGDERARSLGHRVRFHHSEYEAALRELMPRNKEKGHSQRSSSNWKCPVCSVPYFSAMGRAITNRCRPAALRSVF